MDLKHYEDQFPQLINLAKESNEKTVAFFQNILLVAASILAILISLHSNNSPTLYIRWVYVVSLALLALGILATVVVLYDYAKSYERLREAFHTEVETALMERRKVRTTSLPLKKRTVTCKKLSLLFLGIALLLLSLYSCLLSLGF